MAFAVKEFRQLADRHAVAHRLLRVIHKAFGARLRHRPLHVGPSDRVGTVEHDHFGPRLRRRFEEVSERGLVGVEAHARVLDVVHHGVEVLHHVHRRMPLLHRVAINAVHGNLGCGIDGIADVRSIHGPGDAVLRTEDGDQLHAGRMRKDVDRALALGVESALIRHQPDAARLALGSLENVEVTRFQDVEAGLHLSVAEWKAPLRTIRFVVAGNTLQPQLLLLRRGELERRRNRGCRA